MLRQYNPVFLAVSIDDLYGTIQTSETLRLATDQLGLPDYFLKNIPETLPNLSVNLSDITHGHCEVSPIRPQHYFHGKTLDNFVIQ
jgi:hypothetical protein